MSVEEANVLYVLAWLSFAFVHFWLAGNNIKANMHPFYIARLLILWGEAWTVLALATARWARSYLVIRSHFGERRLKQLYGRHYHAHRNRVPVFFS